MELLTAEEMRAMEQAAMDRGDVTGMQLMERAGRGVVEALMARGFATRPHRALVLCGPGNNGGDGYVIARLLRQRGWPVAVAAFGAPGRAAPDACRMAAQWAELGPVHSLLPAPDASVFDALAGEMPDVIVDALFGTGLTRPLPAPLAGWFSDVEIELGRRRRGAFVCAVDLPSGLCSDSGRWLGDVTRTHSLGFDLTVSFHRPKRGHYLAQGPEICGALEVVDIGLPGDGRVTRTVEKVASPRRSTLDKGQGHKFTHGHALIVSGGAGRTGAARLAARAALRIGAGLVSLGVPGSAQQEAAAQLTAIMLTRAGTPDELAAALGDGRINALCLGPGLGLSRARALVAVALTRGGVEPHPTRSVVLDADALSAHAEAPAELFSRLHERCVLTPHGGEFARLFPDIAARLDGPASQGPAWSRIDATRAAAARAGCVVLFKGPDSVIAAPDGRCSVNSAHYDRAAPWLATAGAGDVLAGLITGLLARGLPPMQAAETAAWLHVECARRFGPGMIAEDLPETLPEVLAGLT